MNRFNQIYYYGAVAVIVFVFACNIAHGVHIDHINSDDYHWRSLPDLQEQYSLDPYHTENVKGIDVLDLFQSRRKRGFFWSDDDDDDDHHHHKETVSTTGSATGFKTGFTTATGVAATPKDVKESGANQVQDVMNIVIIGGDVEKSLVVAAPYLPLVHKVATYIVPDLSPYKVVTLSLNVAALTTQASQDNDEGGRNSKSTVSAEESSEVPQTEPDACASFGDYAAGIYGKFKDVFESHFGHIPKIFVDGETTKSSPAQTDSLFDKVESKMYTVHNNGINGYDAFDTENDEHKIETTVTKTYIEGYQPPNSADTIVTKTYESGAETLQQLLKNGETNHVQIANKLIEDGMTVGTQVTEIKKETNNNENSSNESNDSDDDDDEIEKIIESEIKEEEFNRVKEESMGLQPDFVQKLSGEELLKHIDELQNSLSNSNINSKHVFMGLTDRLDIDEDVGDDQIDELVDALVKTTNYFISSALEKKALLTTPPTS